MSGYSGSNSDGNPNGDPMAVDDTVSENAEGSNNFLNVPVLNSASTSNDLASLFECPVCLDYALPPILQCENGHLVCKVCRPKLNECPTCRGPLENIRNLAMEKLASTVMFPCQYSLWGCPVTLLHSDKIKHEEILCEYRPYSCPCPDTSCTWQSGLEDVLEHLKVSHESITTLYGEDIVFLATNVNLEGAVDWVMMQSCFGHYFMLVLEKKNQEFYGIVRLFGSQNQCENFVYKLEINGHRKRLTWESTPRSIHEPVSITIMDLNCLVIDISTVQVFAENGNLGINVTISPST